MFNQEFMRKYGEGVYHIIHERCGWCVARLVGHYDNGAPIWHRVSNLYVYRGWAQAFARRMKLNVQNYASNYA